MKLNFRKIVSALTSAVMIGSTVAMAASFPDPFVKSGQADVAIVVGANAAVDMAAATSIQQSLGTAMGTSTSTTTVTVGEGEKYKFEKSDKLNLGDTLSEIDPSLNEVDLPVLLGDGVYTSDDKEDYDFSQKIIMGGGLELKHFRDTSDYGDAPAIGFALDSGTEVLNYTLKFDDVVETDLDDNGNMLDIKQTSFTMLGREYFVLDADNGTQVKLTLLDAANSLDLVEGETKTVNVGGKTYEVSADVYNEDQVVINVGSESTDTLSASDTYKLSDGTYVGVKEVRYAAKETGISSVKFSLGSGKLILEDTENVELNGEDIDELTVNIATTPSGSKVKLNSISLSWVTESEEFITPSQSLTMPGFEAIKLIMAGMNFGGVTEEVMVDTSSDDKIRLRAPIEDGDADIQLLQGNATKTGWGIIGKEDNLLVTSNSTSITLNTTADEKYFVASRAVSDTEGQTYYLQITDIDEKDGVNMTTIKNVEAGDDECVDLEDGETCEIGDVVLTMAGIAEESGGKGTVTMTINTDGSFNKVYTVGGLTIYLPTTDLATPGTGAINDATWNIKMVESDENEKLGAGAWINVTVGFDDEESTVKTVDSVWSGGDTFETGDGTKIEQGFVQSELATQVLFDTGGDQDTVKIMYHTEESTGEVYLAGGSVSTGGAAPLGIAIFKDSEAASVSSKNLVVVGGSCVNTVAASMLQSSTPLCGADFTAATGVGVNQALVKVAASPLSSSKIAMLVAGYETEDTLKAAKYVTAEKPSTASGTVVKLDTASTTATKM